nr:putative cyclin-B3-1 [Coffea arabica]XP_027100981.1 putative cyclin-B3-1 [Coffea arabica]XP_027127476.1 putative cyclin-B3-1 [Coffea arabica]XP_027127477.1 putative cyclin-B3-1 [Coffea arabica]
MVAVAVKGKSKPSHQVIEEDANKSTKKSNTALGRLPSFKIFAEPPPPSNGGRRLGSATGSQSGIKNLEKNNGKKDSSVKANIGRKVLADISNVRGSFSGPKAHNKSKSLCISRNSAAGTQAGGCSSRMPFTGIVRNNMTQASGSHHTVNKADKDIKITSSNDLGTLTRGCKFVDTSRKSRGDYLPPIRKSFPVTEQVKKVPMNGTKEESTESSERRRGKYGFQVNSKVGRNVASRVHNSQNHLQKVRVSDGYMVMASKGRHNSRPGTISRRSVKVERTLNSNGVCGFNKPPAGSAASSNRKEEKAKCSSTKHVASVILSGQTAQHDVSSSSKSDSDRTTADNVSRRKPDRRKSFTSLLMSQSKDDLPNIYDNHNHLEVTEYVDDIYQYYWVLEAHNQPLKHYLDIQSEITRQMRGILINWLIEVHLRFDLMQETLFLMVTLLDQFLSLVSIGKNKMQLVGLTALLLASKYEDFWHPRIMDLIGISADSYTRDEMLGMENTFLKALKFRLNSPTPYVFMLRVLKAAGSDTAFEHLAFYLIELCLVEYEALKYKPSLLCASAIYLARCTMEMNPTWTPLLEKHSRYRESQIRSCAEMILKFHKAAKTAMLKVTYEKYMRFEFGRVAAINPVEVLPQCSHENQCYKN